MVHMANAFYGVVNPNEVKRVDAPLADIEKYGARSYLRILGLSPFP